MDSQRSETVSRSEKGKMGFQKDFKDQDFINALTDNPQTTSSIAKKVGCSLEWARTKLKKLYENGIEIEGKIVFPVEKLEVEGCTRTGKMYLWMKKKEQED